MEEKGNIKRDISIANISGILIIYMILYHIIQWRGMNNILSSY